MDLPVGGWSNPQKDVLEHIFEHLEDPLDLLQCGRVCRSWFSIARQFSRLLLQNRPPLIVFLDTIGSNCESSSSNATEKGLVFYNYRSRNNCRFSLPAEFPASWISGSSYGWVISIQRENPCKIWLINVVSYAQIRLPNASGFRRTNRLRIIMSDNPASDSNCIILAIDPDKQHLAFCKVGDSSWTKLDTSSLSAGYSCATFYKGRFHVYYHSEQVLQIIDLMASRVPEITTWQTQGSLETERDRDKMHYLLESSGELLLVTKYVRALGQVVFRVHKLDYEKGEWIKIEDLGKNRALFVGYNNSTSVVLEEGGGSRRYGGSTGCRANCIYLIDDSDCCFENQFSSLFKNRGVYYMNNREFKGWIPGLRPVWFHAPLSWICP